MRVGLDIARGAVKRIALIRSKLRHLAHDFDCLKVTCEMNL